MKKTFFKCSIFALFATLAIFEAAAQTSGQNNRNGVTYDPKAPLASTSSVNWKERKFASAISLNMETANIPMPSGKNTAINTINSRLPNLIKDPLLTLCVDSNHTLGDYILEHDITLEDIIKLIYAGDKTLGYFDQRTDLFKINHNMELPDIASLFVRHSSSYSRKKTIDTISSRPYTGIIIDARGKLPVHGEFIDEKVNPCFFPKIWNEDMEIVYERNMMNSALEKKIGECAYDWSDDESRYRDRIGADPLRITAQQVYGRNRTDLIISNDDMLRIFSVPQNAELLKEGKIVLLLDRDVLVHDVAAPIKDDAYYTAMQIVELYDIKKPAWDDLIQKDNGEIDIVYQLNFIPDSPELLPNELPRIEGIADMLKEVLKANAFTFFVAGHTADIGQHENQMKLSVERTQTVIKLLIQHGIDEKLFTYRGYGETMPAEGGDNSTPEGRAKNRRVVITLRPRTTYIQRSW